MKDKKVDTNLTFQVRLDKGWQKILFRLRADLGGSIKSLVEDALTQVYSDKIMKR